MGFNIFGQLGLGHF